MKITYDKEVDVLRIILNDRPISESDEAKPDLILDYDEAGNVVAMEILNASLPAELPTACVFAGA